MKLQALAAGCSCPPKPRGGDRFEEWLAENASHVGRRYTSELTRNFSG